MESRYIQTDLKVEENLSSPDYDGIVLVSGTPPGTEEPEPFKSLLSSASELDCALFELGTILPIDLPAKRVVYSPTGPINPDYDDVRKFSEAANKGIKRALKAGVKSPLLVLLPDPRFENVELVTLLGALQALYVPLEVREIGPDRCHKAKSLGVYSTISDLKLRGIVRLAEALESGRFIARDIGGSDPERMAPKKIEDYIRQSFAKSSIKVEVISDEERLREEYPCLAAVNRAASVIPRHAGRVAILTYEPRDPSRVEDTVMLVGKGVTYDTGGADIKTGGNMLGMSRDKCGAAAAIGFMQVVNLLQPPTTKVVVAVGLVRNSCGENSYVADEVITARSGARVRVTNTDAEGRMVMADILYHMKEKALGAVNPHLFTIATLTGHAVSTVGEGYSIVIDNSVARCVSNAHKLQACGDAMGDMFEVSMLRPEDFKNYKGKAEGDDVLQTRPKGSSNQRGHQGPCAFLIMSSGLDKHGNTADKPLKFSHLDIAANVGMEVEKTATGAPILALANRFFTKEFEKLLTEGKQ